MLPLIIVTSSALTYVPPAIRSPPLPRSPPAVMVAPRDAVLKEQIRGKIAAYEAKQRARTFECGLLVAQIGSRADLLLRLVPTPANDEGATGAARSPESTRVLAAVGATRQKYSRPRPVSGQYEPVLRGGGTAPYGGIRPVPEHLTWYARTK